MNGPMIDEVPSSPRFRRVLGYADAEAARLQHDSITTAHLLLGLIREGDGVALVILRQLGVDLSAVAATIEQLAPRGSATMQLTDRPLTLGATEALSLARHAAADLDHSYLGTEHLLLGVLGNGEGLGAQVLHQVGVTSDAARRETLRCLYRLSPK